MMKNEARLVSCYVGPHLSNYTRQLVVWYISGKVQEFMHCIIKPVKCIEVHALGHCFDEVALYIVATALLCRVQTRSPPVYYVAISTVCFSFTFVLFRESRCEAYTFGGCRAGFHSTNKTRAKKKKVC